MININTCKAGPVMDRLVAVKGLGWTYKINNLTPDRPFEVWHDIEGIPYYNEDFPEFSTSTDITLNEVLPAVRKLRYKGGGFKVDYHRDSDFPHVSAEFKSIAEDDDTWRALIEVYMSIKLEGDYKEAEVLALVICRAFLALLVKLDKLTLEEIDEAYRKDGES